MILGIDPGLEGGFVGLDDSGNHFFSFMPLKEKDVDYRAVLAVLDSVTDFCGGVEHVFLERAMPMAMGSRHAFNYGRGFAALEIAIQTAKLPVTYVEPTKWMKVMFEGIDTNLKPKIRAQIAAERLFPELGRELRKGNATKLHTGLVDALLIAEYGRRKLKSGA